MGHAYHKDMERLEEDSEIHNGTGRFLSLIAVESWAYRGKDRFVANQHVLFREWINTHIPRPLIVPVSCGLLILSLAINEHACERYRS